MLIIFPGSVFYQVDDCQDILLLGFKSNELSPQTDRDASNENLD